MRARTLPVGLAALVIASSGLVPPALQAQEDDDVGIPVEHPATVAACARCHRVDDEGRMTRISYLRKTPEGWQTSMRRMVALHDVEVSPEQARDIVRYLSNQHGIAPEELRPALYEVERRQIDYDWDGDSGVEYTCIVCHTLGRVQTQRRTREEWGLLLATHRALYPLVDFQAFRRSGPAPTEPGPGGAPPDPRHPMDKAIDVLSKSFPLETPEWSAWAANKRSPRLAGTWVMSGYQRGKGPVYGTVTIAADPADPDAFTTVASYTFPESGERASRSGQGLVYTGFQWRGRSDPGGDHELREVMFVERDQRSMHGRWFTGAYDELGLDVELRRVGAEPLVTGAFPKAVARGAEVVVRVFGGGIPQDPSTSDLDFGQGVTVRSVERDGGAMRVTLLVGDDAAVGSRDLFAFGRVVEEALVVHDGVDRVEVAPGTGMARAGGGNFPKGYEIFEAIGYDDGPDGESGTDDDLELGRVDATWSLEEYTATYDDDDLDFVGSIHPRSGVFTPALDGPNPDRAGNRNNIGDVWVIATHRAADGDELRARAHLLVTVPNYMRFEPWRQVNR